MYISIILIMMLIILELSILNPLCISPLFIFFSYSYLNTGLYSVSYLYILLYQRMLKVLTLVE